MQATHRREIAKACLCAPLRVDSVADHSGTFLLAVVWQRREDAVLSGLNG